MAAIRKRTVNSIGSEYLYYIDQCTSFCTDRHVLY